MRKLVQCCVMLLLMVNFVCYAHSRPIVVDTDLGTDDFQALALLANNKSVDIKAITVLADGENTCPEGMAQLKRFLHMSHLESVPTACADLTPISGKIPRAWHLEMDWFAPHSLPTHEYRHDPVRLLSQTLASVSEPVTFIELAPFTHLAKLYKQHPQLLAKKVKRIYFTGISLFQLNNYFGKYTSWNIALDEPSFLVILKHFSALYVVDVNAQEGISLDQVFKTLSMNHQLFAKFVYQILKHNLSDLFVADQLTGVLSLEPGFCKWQMLSKYRHLRSVKWMQLNNLPKNFQTKICLSVSQEKFNEAYIRLLS